MFSWVCWIWPVRSNPFLSILANAQSRHYIANLIVNQLFGVTTGLGMSMITFDWGQIAYFGSPIVPWWAEVNIFIGFIFFYWLLTPSCTIKTCVPLLAVSPLITNCIALSFGISATSPYLRVASLIALVSRTTLRRWSVHTFNLNQTAYEEYSPLYLTTTYTAVYSLAFALATSVLVHTVLYHGQSIIAKLKNVRTDPEDVHAKLMRYYPEVPDWWYMIFFVIFFALGIVAIEVRSTLRLARS